MLEGKLIGLNNYNAHTVFVVTPNRSNGLGIAAYENDMPGVERFSFDELRFINQKSTVIRNGELRIDEDVEEEVKKALGIYSITENDWTPEEILDVVLHPTPTKLEGIKKITSQVTLDHFISVISAEEEKKEYMIADHVREVVIARRAELLNGKLKSEIKVISKATAPKTESRDKRVAKTPETKTKK